MEIIKINCNSCGANLNLPETVNYFQCSFCGSNLKLVKDKDVLFTEVLDDLVEKTESISQDTRIIKIEKAIERLDRDWESKKEALGMEEKDASTSSPFAMIISGILMIGFMVFMFSLVTQQQSKFDQKFKQFPAGKVMTDSDRYDLEAWKKKGYSGSPPLKKNKPKSSPFSSGTTWFLLIILIVIASVLYQIFSAPAKISEFKKAQEAYLAQRLALLEQLNSKS